MLEAQIQISESGKIIPDKCPAQQVLGYFGMGGNISFWLEILSLEK